MSFIVLCAHKTEAKPYAKQHPSIQLFKVPTFQLLHEYRLPENPEFVHIC